MTTKLLIRVCAWCKRVWDPAEGNWVPITFSSEAANLCYDEYNETHTICSDCDADMRHQYGI